MWIKTSPVELPDATQVEVLSKRHAVIDEPWSSKVLTILLRLQSQTSSKPPSPPTQTNLEDWSKSQHFNNPRGAPSILSPSRSATVASLVAQSATSTPQLTMASPEEDNRAAVVLSCVVTRQMDSSPTPLPLAVQAATTPPLLGEVAAESSMAPKSQWAVLKFERLAVNGGC